MRSWMILLCGIASIAVALSAIWWRSYPTGVESFDTGENGLWIGHKWYDGHEVRTGQSVPYAEVGRLVERLRFARVRYVFVHVGPIRADGSIEDSADPLFSALRAAYPEGLFLAWLGARLETIPLADEQWRKAAVDQIERLREEGFDGVHFDLEPLQDGQTGYLELLAAVRHAVGADWKISQATPRSAPFGISIGPLRRSFWSGGFYRATMEFADQTVLMAYETSLPFEVSYVAFVRDQTRRLVDWACRANKHEVLIGIPSFHDGPDYSDPSAENIRSAALGVRAALESFPTRPACFRGVSVYANWVTEESEWLHYDDDWLDPGP